MFTRNFICVSALNFFIMVPYYLLFVISTPYAVSRFQTSTSVAGLVAGTMILGCLAGRFVSGRLIELVGSNKVLFFGIAEFIVSMGLYLAAGTLPLLVVVRFLSGVGMGCISTVTGTLIAHIIPPERHGVGISYFSLSTILAMAFGPFLGMFLLGKMSYSGIFLLCCLFAVVCLVFALLMTASIPGCRAAADGRAASSRAAAGGGTASNRAAAGGGAASSRAAADGWRSFKLNDYIEYQAIPISIVVLLVSQGYGNVQAFMAFYAGELGLQDAAGVFFLLYALVVFLSRPLTGKLLDKRGENVIVYPALLLLAFGLLLLSRAESSWVFLLSAVCIGAGFGNFQSTSQIISVKVVPKRRFAQATSTFFIFLDLGIGFGPYLFGKLAPWIGYQGLYLSLAGLSLVCLPVYYVLHGRGKR